MKKIESNFSLKSIIASSLVLGAVLATPVEAATTLRIASQHAPDQYASEVLRQIKVDLESACIPPMTRPTKPAAM